MKVSIRRDKELFSFEVEAKTTLEALLSIKTTQDASLCFSSGCRSGVCGSCGVMVNGVQRLACVNIAQDGDIIEPLANMPLVRDLVVDMQKAYEFNKKAGAWQGGARDGVEISHDESKINELQSDCILCSLCYSACPVYAVNEEFLGPFALTRVWRYASDKREGAMQAKIDTIQTNGVWDCTLCSACTVVCPQGISSKADIEKLRTKSALFGYMDPSFGSFGGFGFSF